MPAYDAFISYSHAKDKPIAAALQSVVQRLGKPWYRRRALRVFRDDTSLSATPHLWPSIEQALAQSRFLILLASPEAAASPWVGKEIEYWLAHKSPETLLIAQTGGMLGWDHAKGDFAWSDATPLPAVLRGKFAAEPRWVDLGAYRDGANPRDARFMDLGADFAAAIHGMPKEDLLSQEVRQQRRALTLAWSAAGTLFVLGGLAVWQWQVASIERQRAVDALGAARKTAEPKRETLVFDLARELRNRPGMPVDLVNDILERVQTLQRQLGSAGSTVELLRLEAASLTELSDSYQRQGNRAAALEAIRRAVAILEAISKQHPDQRLVQRDLAVGLNQLADLLRDDAPWSEVLALHRRALALVERLAAADPDNLDLQRDVWLTSNKIAEVQTLNQAYDGRARDLPRRLGAHCAAGRPPSGRSGTAGGPRLQPRPHRHHAGCHGPVCRGARVAQFGAVAARTGRRRTAARHPPAARRLCQPHPRRRSARGARPANRSDRHMSAARSRSTRGFSPATHATRNGRAT